MDHLGRLKTAILLPFKRIKEVVSPFALTQARQLAHLQGNGVQKGLNRGMAGMAMHT